MGGACVSPKLRLIKLLISKRNGEAWPGLAMAAAPRHGQVALELKPVSGAGPGPL